MKKLLFLLFFSLPLFSYEVLTYGNACIDYFVFVDNAFLANLPGERGGSHHVDLPTFTKLIENYKHTCAGGSGINTIKGLSLLGHGCAVIGRIGNDPEAEKFQDSLRTYGISPLFHAHNAPTDRVVCLISPEGNRTMRTHITKSKSFASFPINDKLFKGIKLFHIEGYQIPNTPFLKQLIAKAKKEKAVISMDMGCFELVEKYKEVLLDLIAQDIDILFCNAQEGKMLTGMDPEQACKKLAKLCKIAVVTNGEQGGFVGHNQTHFTYQAIPASIEDDTGAGDLFMAGFLHRFLLNDSLENCAREGAFIASKIIQNLGGELPKEIGKEIQNWEENTFSPSSKKELF